VGLNNGNNMVSIAGDFVIILRLLLQKFRTCLLPDLAVSVNFLIPVEMAIRDYPLA